MKNKIMFYTMSLQKGGAERVITTLSNYLIKKYDVTIVTNLNTPSHYQLDKKIKHIKLDKLKGTNKMARYCNKILKVRTKKLKKIIEQEQPSIIIAFLPEPSFRVLSIKDKLNIPVIISDRNDPKVEYKNILINKKMKKLYRKADGFVFQTDEAMNYFNGIIKCESIIIPNPINDKFIKKPYSKKRKKEIVTVGRLEKQKNQKLLINSFEEISDKYPEYKLYIYGEGKLKNKLIKHINKINMNDKVYLMGKSDKIEDEIYKSNIFVLSSDYEGMPNALMEAMALGLPCISTNCSGGGAKFLIENDINGILIDNKSPKSIANAMERIINDENFANKIAENANKISEKYNCEYICKQWENFIENKI